MTTFGGIVEQIKHNDLSPAHRRFAAMAAAYTLGTFNDNFFKQAVMLKGQCQGTKLSAAFIM